jgi:hypothetical protein
MAEPTGFDTLPRDFGADWRAVTAALGRVDLNRPLPPYPHQGQGLTPPFSNTPLAGPYDRFDDPDRPEAIRQSQAALAARQQLADDIYRRLLAVTGVPPVQDRANPTPDELVPRRWLAQLAVNIVDYIDEDDISTPFLFYTADDAGNPTNPPFNPGAGSTTELPRYWVFGTERPNLVVNEVLAQARDATGQQVTGYQTIMFWIELHNTLHGPTPAPVQPQDGYAIPLWMPGIARSANPRATANSQYPPYTLVVHTGLADRSRYNDNVTGVQGPYSDHSVNLPKYESFLPTFSPTSLLSGDPQPDTPQRTPKPYVPAGGYLLVAPRTAVLAPYRDPLAPGTRVPFDTPVTKSSSMYYAAVLPRIPPHDPPDERGGLAVLLRRAPNPHLPVDFNPVFTSGPQAGQLNPWYNPYVTVDYMDKIPLRDIRYTDDDTTYGPNHKSRGKRQPYGAVTKLSGGDVYFHTADSPVADQEVDAVNGIQHTFGRPNFPLPRTGKYDWLVHLDRQPVSPMELLHVSACQPYQLTQRFVRGDNTNPANRFQHQAPWADESRRLYRLFEFLECGSRAAGVRHRGRVPGKINLNTVWDVETFRALCDANPSNHVSSQADVDAIFNRMVALRTPGPGHAPGPTNVDPSAIPPGYRLNRPFLGMGPGPTWADLGSQFPGGLGIEDTFLRSSGGADGTVRLFQKADPAGTHPYLQYQLLTKIYNHLTCRSNVFAVWLTVGFFEVTDATTRPPTQGAEIGRAEGRHVRHRMFAIVDRSNLQAFSTRATAAVTLSPGQPQTTAPVRLAATSGTISHTAHRWETQEGSVLVYEPDTDREETVVVWRRGADLVATFTRAHPDGAQVIRRGNPGPWARYDPRQDRDVVLYFSIIH